MCPESQLIASQADAKAKQTTTPEHFSVLCPSVRCAAVLKIFHCAMTRMKRTRTAPVVERPLRLAASSAYTQGDMQIVSFLAGKVLERCCSALLDKSARVQMLRGRL